MIDFALLGHPADFHHFVALVDRDGRAGERIRKHRALMEKFVEWAPSYVGRDVVHLALPDGRTLSGRMIVCPFLPETLDGPREIKQAHGKILAAARLASAEGARVAALGGFTSILEARAQERLSKDDGTVLTSGNMLTASLAVRQIEALLLRAGHDLARRKVAVVGATGDIGRIASRLLSGRVGTLLLIARFLPRLKRLAEELSAQGAVDVAVDIAAVRGADTVLLAAGSRHAVADEEVFKPGTLVCDVGYPKNVSYSEVPRPDIAVFSGGLAQLPAPLNLQAYTRLPAPDLIFGCYAEAMVLSGLPDGSALAASQFEIDMARVREVELAALAMGFRPAPAWRGGTPLEESALAAVLDVRQ